MPKPSPFHERTSQLCTSMAWKDWAGYYAVTHFDACYGHEYYAMRHACALQDVTPLYKYRVSGPDAARFLSRVTVKDVAKMRKGRVTYTCWCDEQGKVLDDGTIHRFDEDEFLVTAAEPCLFWFARFQRGHDVEVEDVTETMGVLSLQGPTSREALSAATETDQAKLRFFRTKAAKIAGVDVRVSRTGYSGDRGYEIWVPAAEGVKVYDAVMAAGADFGVTPNGLDALDVARIEAGFVMNGVDYFSSHQCLIEARKSTPYELGLGWTVDLDRERFLGQAALQREVQEGSRWAFVGLEVDWDELEARFNAHGLPPELPHGAWRSPTCLYDLAGYQVGRATSGAFSPTLKKNLALATIDAAFAAPGTELEIEWMVEFSRERLPATVRETPFFDPERKRK